MATSSVVSSGGGGTEEHREVFIVMALATVVASLPHLSMCLPAKVSPLALFIGILGCFCQALRMIDSGRGWKVRDLAARKRLLEEIVVAKSERSSAEERADRAEQIRASDSKRLAALQSELDAFGDADARAKRLEISDEAITSAAEHAWYRGQLAGALEAKAQHGERAQTLYAELPALQGQASGLDVALADVKSQARQAQSDRQTMDSSAEQLREQVEQLRKFSREQKEELQRLEDEMQALQKSAEEAKQQLLGDQKRQSWEIEREVTEEERKARWARGEKRATEADNEALRTLLMEKDGQVESAEQDLERAENERANLESELATLKHQMDELESSNRERERAERDLARERERRGRVQNNREELKNVIREAEAARDEAEKALGLAKKAASERASEGDKIAIAAEEEKSRCIETFQQAAADHKQAVANVQQTHAELCNASKRAEQLQGRLQESEQERARLHLELQQMASDGNDAEE